MAGRALCLLVLLASVAVLMAYPVPDPDPQYVEEAVRQAAALNLLPPYATVDKIHSSIELGYYKLGPHQQLNLGNLLGHDVPRDVLSSLQAQVDSLGGGYQH